MIKCTVKTKDIDKGWNRIKRELALAKKKKVIIGYWGDKVHEDSTATIAGIAAIHEYGAPKANIPARPFMSTTFDEKVKENIRLTISLFNKVIRGAVGTVAALSAMGEINAGWIRKKITDIKSPPLKHRDGNPLVDTGALRNACTSKVVPK